MEDNVLIYHPMATVRRKDRSTERLYTGDGCYSKEEALDVIKKWSDDYDYHLISAEIKVSNINRPDLCKWIRVF